jgi:GNAT superfamily N-acetyltransferase
MSSLRPQIGAIITAPPSQADAALPAITLPVLVAASRDAQSVVDVLAEGFLNDPTWSWAFPDPAARRRWWEVSVEGALRYPWILRTAGYEAVSVWIPPDGTELAPEQEAQVPDTLRALIGPRQPEVMELLRRFGEAHPRAQPHYYLSLLAVADAHRGRGLGMALLAENLARIDAEGFPAYLESSNPANNHRYEALGFSAVVSFQAPGGGPPVTGMWRDPQGTQRTG